MTFLTRRNSNYDVENPFFNDFFSVFDKESKLLKSDIKEADDKYIIDVEVPGINKENIKISLENELLTVEVETKEEKVNYLHKERYVGVASRSFHVGDIKQEDVKASFNNGILTLEILKETYNKIEEKKYISIN